MNWLKRLFHMEEPELVEKPEPEPPILESCPICGCTPKPKYIRIGPDDCYYILERRRWLLLEACEHSAIVYSFAQVWYRDNDIYWWNLGCRELSAVVDEPVSECPVCGENPIVQPDTESDIPQLVCSCNELLDNEGIANVYQRKHEWLRRCRALKRKQDNVTEMEQLIGEAQ